MGGIRLPMNGAKYHGYQQVDMDMDTNPSVVIPGRESVFFIQSNSITAQHYYHYKWTAIIRYFLSKFFSNISVYL
jgi:hypothetical protein